MRWTSQKFDFHNNDIARIARLTSHHNFGSTDVSRTTFVNFKAWHDKNIRRLSTYQEKIKCDPNLTNHE